MPLACLVTRSRHAVSRPKPRLWQTRFFATTTHRAYVPNPSEHQFFGEYTPRTSPNPYAKSIGILGGGISGLTAAFNLSRDIPDAKITIYEAKSRLGGWMESEIVKVDGGEVLFEWGPRSLRPDFGGSGQATVALLDALDSQGDGVPVLSIPKTAPAATNRFIYYPDHLVRMPARDPARGTLGNIISNLTNIINEPIFDGVITSILKEPYQKVRSNDLKDESVGDLVSRRFGKAVADNLLSALFHGIYAGDIYKLSARTLLPALWHLETRDKDGNGILMELAELFFRQHGLLPYGPLEFQNRYMKTLNLSWTPFFKELSQASVYTFPLGLQQLSDTVLKVLKTKSNVSIEADASVNGLAFDKTNRKFAVTTSRSEPSSPAEYKHDYLISTLAPAIMSELLPAETKPPALISAFLRSSNSVTVLVVNLYYSTSSFASIPDGFGYLLPRTVPIDQNPERALGVIFGSCTSGPRGDAAIVDREWHPPTAEYLQSYREAAASKHKQAQEAVEKLENQLKQLSPSPGLSATAVDDLRAAIRTHIDSIKEGIPVVDEDLEMMEESKDDPVRKWKERVGQDTAPGTKLTVMIGGHWWSGWQSEDYPTEQEGIEMAKAVIRRHLQIEEEPAVAKAKLQRDCIPQYQVGYRDDMAEIHSHLTNLFEGRLKVIGPPWQGGVGVNDCIKRAREISTVVREGWDEKTGLEGFATKEKWCINERRTRTIYKDPLS